MRVCVYIYISGKGNQQSKPFPSGNTIWQNPGTCWETPGIYYDPMPEAWKAAFEKAADKLETIWQRNLPCFVALEGNLVDRLHASLADMPGSLRWCEEPPFVSLAIHEQALSTGTDWASGSVSSRKDAARELGELLANIQMISDPSGSASQETTYAMMLNDVWMHLGDAMATKLASRVANDGETAMQTCVRIHREYICTTDTMKRLKELVCKATALSRRFPLPAIAVGATSAEVASKGTTDAEEPHPAAVALVTENGEVGVDDEEGAPEEVAISDDGHGPTDVGVDDEEGANDGRECTSPPDGATNGEREVANGNAGASPPNGEGEVANSNEGKYPPIGTTNEKHAAVQKSV